MYDLDLGLREIFRTSVYDSATDNILTGQKKFKKHSNVWMNKFNTICHAEERTKTAVS